MGHPQRLLNHRLPTLLLEQGVFLLHGCVIAVLTAAISGITMTHLPAGRVDDCVHACFILFVLTN
jgi:hypothetical protein